MVISTAVHPDDASGVISSKQKLETGSRAARKCNINVCYAIDGSGSIKSSRFKDNLNFAEIVSAVLELGQRSYKFSANQFGTTVESISGPTNLEGFLEKLSSVKKVGGLSFIGGGIAFCISDLLSSKADKNVLVLLTDGFSGIGPSDEDTSEYLQGFGFEVIAVQTGVSDFESLLAYTGGKRSNVLSVSQFFKAVGIIEELSGKGCT